MPAAPNKTRTLFGVLGKIESSYGAGGALSASTDAIELHDTLEVPDHPFLYDGTRGVAEGTGGTKRRLAPKGEAITFPLEVEGKPYGSAISLTTHIPADLDVILRATGHARTLTGGNKQVYAPVSGSFESANFELYFDGVKWLPIGCYGDLEWTGKAAEPTYFKAAMQGFVTAAVAENAVPAITYGAQAVDVPTLAGATFTLNGVSLDLKEFSFKTNRKVTPRRSAIATGGHAGFHIGRRAPTFSVVVEAVALATFNPEALLRAATEFPAVLSYGSGAGKVLYLGCPRCQIIPGTLKDTDEDGVVTWSFDMQVNPSTPTANDDYTIENQ